MGLRDLEKVSLHKVKEKIISIALDYGADNEELQKELTILIDELDKQKIT